MRRVILFAFLGCLGCLSEKKTDPGVPSTFVKYFNGGFNDVAQDIKPTSDGGYLLLATTEVKQNEVSEARYKIKLIKTDEFGSLQWQRIYPDYDNNIETEDPIDSVSFKGRSLLVMKDISGIETGYVVVGDSIQKGSTSQSHIRLMLTDLNGNITKARNFKPGFEAQGSGITVNDDGNFVVLGSAVNNQATTNMILAELDQDLNTVWIKTYGAGTSKLANKLFINNQSVYWAGTVIKNNRSDIRFVKTPPNSENTDFDLPIGTPNNNETGNDICPYGFGYAVIGTTDELGDEDILFKRLTEDGTELASMIFGSRNQSENGLAICQAKDGGLILLGNVDTSISAGRGGKDYFLIKINAFGDTEWTRTFGSKNDDAGAAVLANSDGTYTILGTTLFGGLRTLALIKTDNLGRIE